MEWAIYIELVYKRRYSFIKSLSLKQTNACYDNKKTLFIFEIRRVNEEKRHE